MERISYRRSDNKLPLNDVGLVNYTTVGWLSSTMWKAYKVISLTGNVSTLHRVNIL